jgi:hypothetical protein
LVEGTGWANQRQPPSEVVFDYENCVATHTIGNHHYVNNSHNR